MADSTVATEATPLVSDGNGTTVVNDSPPPLQEMKEQSLREKIVLGLSTLTFGCSVASMLFVSNVSVYVSGILGAGIAPLAAMQQQKLTQCEALRQTNQRIESEVEILGSENDRLSGQVGELETTVDHLQDLQKTLNTVQALEGDSIEELERQVAESEKILKSMNENLAGDVIQTIISVMMAINQDGDDVLSPEEIDLLMQKMENLHAVDVKEDLLRAKLTENGNSLSAVMSVIKNLLDPNVPQEENIFNFVHEDDKVDALGD